jgi:DNA-binding NtrC family response regulator
LFLDEIADMSVSTQAKVLRIIQEKEFEKVGGRKTVQVDTRIIAATNKDLKREVREGRFREDLYYRLNVVRIHVPPLAERMEDVPLLLNHFIDLLCQENNRGIIEFTPEAINCLNSYHWPGNVRELENEVKRLLALNAGSLITMEDLSKTITHDKVINRGKVSPLKEKVRTLEVEMIKNALEETKGNQVQTAKLLGLSRHGLIKKIKRYGLKDCRKSGKL